MMILPIFIPPSGGSDGRYSGPLIAIGATGLLFCLLASMVALLLMMLGYGDFDRFGIISCVVGCIWMFVFSFAALAATFLRGDDV